jgi:imidazole glycerol-phosphate synthase subunit HisF
MLRPRVIPCLLLKGDGLVKTVKFRDPKYVGDPINAIRIFNDKQVDELVVLDIAASREQRPPQIDLIREFASECFMPLAYGGGIRSSEDVRAILSAGVEKVVLNTMALEDPGRIAEVAHSVGRQSVVVSIDVKRKFLGGYEVYGAGGTRAAGVDPVTFARRMEAQGAGEILLNAIDRDGVMQGYDLALVKLVSESVSIPVVAAGGAGSLQHMAEVLGPGHASAAAAGSMFVFHGRHRAVLISYPTSDEIESLASGAPALLREQGL